MKLLVAYQFSGNVTLSGINLYKLSFTLSVCNFMGNNSSYSKGTESRAIKVIASHISTPA